MPDNPPAMIALPAGVAVVVRALFLRRKLPDRRFVREPVDRVTLVAGKGAQGCRSFGRSRTRHLNLLPAGFYDWYAAQPFGRRMGHGSAGETVVLDADVLSSGPQSGFDLVSWMIGQPENAICRLGTAGLRLIGPRTPCSTAAGILVPGDPNPGRLTHRLGVMATIVADGEVRIGDRLEVG